MNIHLNKVIILNIKYPLNILMDNILSSIFYPPYIMSKPGDLFQVSHSFNIPRSKNSSATYPNPNSIKDSFVGIPSLFHPLNW